MAIETYKNGKLKEGGEAGVDTPSEPSFESHTPSIIPLDVLSHQDPIAHRRDPVGGRLPSNIAYRNPAAGHDKAKDCAFGEVIDAIAQSAPLVAAKIRHDYDDKLVPAQKELAATIRHAHEELRLIQKESLRRDAIVDAALLKLQEKKAAALAPLKNEHEQTLEEVEARSLEAAEAYSKAGSSFDPAAPSEVSLVRVPRLSASEVAKEMGVRKPELHEVFTSKVAYAVHYVLTVLVGILVGVSVGIVAGILVPQRLQENVAVLAIFAAIGLAIALLSHKAVVHAFQTAAESAFQGASRSSAPKFALAFSVLFSLLAADIVVERQGILKIAQTSQLLASQGGTKMPQTPETVYYLLSAIITLGFFVCAAYEGYLLGERLKEFADAQQAKREQLRRNEPEVVAALHTLGNFVDAKRKEKLVQDRLIEVTSQFLKEEASLESQRISYPLGLTENQKKLIQDAIDQVTGTQFEIDVQIEKLVNPPGFFKRLVQSIKDLFFRKRMIATVRKDAK